MGKKTKKCKNLAKKLGKNALLGAVTLTFATLPVSASEPSELAQSVIASEGGRQALDTALKTARSKPALSAAALIVCLACPPVAGAGASASMCVACGILVAKVVG
jgi:hypothetical protein